MAAETLIEVNVPQGVTVTLSGAALTVKGQKGQVSREFRFPGIKLVSADGKITVEASRFDKQTKATVGTYASHIRNMLTGVTDGYEYNMKIVYSHFPIQVNHGSHRRTEHTPGQYPEPARCQAEPQSCRR